ncbi:Pycsar system effector family protein [Altererythrobacter sp. Root672]|uniref:Pycsar system effector family protein n=1 Tax=Altererythrobacter sp. Root672 TaxID=1736584 RepID=UPI0006F95779|nr:Pycsar system effector family protein [Altererythrobacter sp. Root672]KRA81672.1 hypothetical protein ASD76_12725 [Altererythrobacter sp. Root672]
MAETGAGPEPGGEGPAYSPNAIHLLRTAQRNTLVLAQMADQKASILMGACFLVFSIAVSRTLIGHLPWSLAILALFAFLSALCGAIAVMPSVGKPATTEQRNWLFFGHYHDRNEQEWADDLLGELKDDEEVFRLMLRDIYQNGQVLHRRKYRFLGYAYRLFIAGLVITLAAFAVELSQVY